MKVVSLAVNVQGQLQLSVNKGRSFSRPSGAPVCCFPTAGKSEGVNPEVNSINFGPGGKQISPGLSDHGRGGEAGTVNKALLGCDSFKYHLLYFNISTLNMFMYI